MSHYSTLQDYQFDADVKDIRGAALYGTDQSKIGKITECEFVKTSCAFNTKNM